MAHHLKLDTTEITFCGAPIEETDLVFSRSLSVGGYLTCVHCLAHMCPDCYKVMCVGVGRYIPWVDAA